MAAATPERDSSVRALALPIAAVAALVIVVGGALVGAGATLGYDLYAYVHAAERFVHGQPLYDPTVNVAGGFAIYLYPPPFLLLALPFVPLTNALGPWPWITFLVLCFLAGVAVLPVRRDVRWLILLLGGLSWPLAYSLKLGQVGPILFLLFAIGWRSLDRPRPLGISMALGTIIKIQPALLFAWAVLGGRWRATIVGLAVLLVAAAASTLVTGSSTWADYFTLLARVSSPVTTPHNFAPGAIAYQLGASEAIGQAIQWLSTLVAVGLVVYAALRAGPAVGYLSAVTAGQLVSPILWDHYAILLLLPAAWLLDRRHWWAVAIPLATSVFLLWLPPVTYPVVFWLALVAPFLDGSVATSRSSLVPAPSRPDTGLGQPG